MALPKADTSELVYLAAILAALERIEAALTPPPPAPTPAKRGTRKP